MRTRLLIPGLILASLSGCGPTYSPDTYASNAVQQANKVEQGVIVGVRDVAVSASDTVGTVTGAAAGGIAGSQVGVGVTSAFASLGGALVGGIAGSAAAHASEDTKAFEYIVKKGNGDLVSVTQKDKTPLALGQHVLVIAGNQARVVPDYTLPPDVRETQGGRNGQAGGCQTPPAATPAPASAAAAAAVSPPPAAASQPDTANSAAKPANAPPADAKPAVAAAEPTVLHPVRTDAAPAQPAAPATP